MSQPIAETYVTIRPDTREFGRDLKTQVEADVKAFTERLRSQLTPKAFARAERTGVLAAGQKNVALESEIRYTRELEAAQRAQNAQATSGIGAMVRSRATFIGLGLASVALAKAVNDVGNAIRVTGDDALTTEGRLRNLGASVAQLDLAGVGKQGGELAALAFQPGAAGAQQAAQDAKKREDALSKALTLTKEYVTVQQQLARATGQVGTAEGVAKAELQNRLRVLQSAIEQLPADQRRLGFAQLGLGDFGTPNQKVIARNQTGPTDQDYSLRALRAAQTKTTQDDLAIQKERAAFLETQISHLEAQGADTEAAKSQLQTLYGQLGSAQDEIASIEAEANRKRQEALQREISTAQTRLAITAANARTQSQEITALQAQAAYDAKLSGDRRLTEQERLQYELAAAQDRKQIANIEQSIADERKRQAEEAKRQAEEERRQNAEKLKRQKEAAAQLRELRLSNAEAKASLTASSADDKKAIRASIAYYKQLVKNTTGLEREQARSSLISARGRLKGVQSSGGSTVRDFFQEVLSDFRSFGSNVASSPNGILSGQQALGAFSNDVIAKASRKTLGDALAEERTRLGRQQLGQQKETNTLLRKISNDIAHSPRTPSGKIPPDVASTVQRVAAAVLHGV